LSRNLEQIAVNFLAGELALSSSPYLRELKEAAINNSIGARDSYLSMFLSQIRDLSARRGLSVPYLRLKADARYLH
jgi:hypothetical protein